MSWISVRLELEGSVRDARSVNRVHYDGPHGPATGAADIVGGVRMKRPAVEEGQTAVTGADLPKLSLDCGYGPMDSTLRKGIEGSLGDVPLRIVRPRYGLLPSSRAVHFELDDGRRWMLVSSGFAKCELRRESSDGAPIFHAMKSVAVADEIEPEEVALVVACETLGSLYQLTKIGARFFQGI